MATTTGLMTPGTTTPKIATADDVNATYNSLFGRPAEAAALPFWQEQATKNGWDANQLSQKIASSAQGADQVAKSSLDGKGNLGQNWQSSLDVNDVGKGVQWDAANNRWGPPNAATPAAAPSLMSVPKAEASSYDPTLSSVNQPTDTVQGQIDAIIAKNSPLMQRAEARADEQMNARGLQNSSMAIGAGQAAVIDAAMPIAGADANIYNQTRFNNQNASNTASQFNANAENQISVANMDTAARMAVADQQIKSDVAKFNASQSNDLIKLGMDAQTRTGLANIEAGYKTLLQSSAGASDMYKQALTSMTSILTNKDITNKTAAMNDIVQGLNDGLGLLGDIANLKLGSILTFTDSEEEKSAAASAATAASSAEAAAARRREGGGA